VNDFYITPIIYSQKNSNQDNTIFRQQLPTCLYILMQWLNLLPEE